MCSQLIVLRYFAVQDPEEPVNAAVCKPPPPAQEARLWEIIRCQRTKWTSILELSVAQYQSDSMQFVQQYLGALTEGKYI